MKKNIGKLIAQVERSTSATRKDGLKVTCKNANNYVNKILVDSEQYNKIGKPESYVNEEMKVYQNEGNKNISDLSNQMKKKTEKKTYTLEHHLTALEKKLLSSFSPLYLEELMDVLRGARK